MTDKLAYELLKRIFGHLGAVPGSNFGLVGLVTQQYLHDKTITVEFDDGSIKNYPIWIGQIVKYRAALTNLGTIDNPEFIMILSTSLDDDGITLGLKLQWLKSSGQFMCLVDKTWRPMSMLHSLNLAAAFEIITQEGVIWIPLEKDEQLYNHLISFVEVENYDPATGPDHNLEKDSVHFKA